MYTAVMLNPDINPETTSVSRFSPSLRLSLAEALQSLSPCRAKGEGLLTKLINLLAVPVQTHCACDGHNQYLEVQPKPPLVFG